MSGRMTMDIRPDMDSHYRNAITMESFPDEEIPRALAAAQKSVGNLGGSGHYRGDDREVTAGGPRNEMDREALVKVLALIGNRASKVNFKFRADQNLRVDVNCWMVQFKSALQSAGGNGNYYFSMGRTPLFNRDSPKISVSVEQLSSKDQHVYSSEELTSELVDCHDQENWSPVSHTYPQPQKQQVKFQRTDGEFIRLNVTIVGPRPPY
ncbi:Oidioi.mRNA.OKI2018_I69.chr1.g1794.t1.cds [Oikopleura dioica]|uniref:Oidioi.mRNA.OKI2018_I69.chr1.g1794.t1.cds n=1 Tax=Oikopleura dioica TaxID=34765 RepID=A0ABN7SVB1_OIKDI|nr:Oidioi.mRNA.OKI2018_I69.chr1.g1794.t1.cds [Oikopleura dioica]